VRGPLVLLAAIAALAFAGPPLGAALGIDVNGVDLLNRLTSPSPALQLFLDNTLLTTVPFNISSELNLTGGQRWVPVWVLAVVAVHFFPLAPVLGSLRRRLFAICSIRGPHAYGESIKNRGCLDAAGVFGCPAGAGPGELAR